jgi:hypothetical protein
VRPCCRGGRRRRWRPAPPNLSRIPANRQHVAAGLVLATAIVALAVGGALVGERPSDVLARRLLWLDGERNVPAAFSALLLVGAGATAAVVAVRRRYAGRACWWTVALAVLLPLLAVDEALEIHERVSDRVGIGWVQLYVPVAIAAAIAWAAALRAARTRAIRVALVAGAACWMLAMLLEYLEWPEDGSRADGYAAMMVVEETVEMLGSLLFWAAFAMWLGYRPASHSTGSPDDSDAPISRSTLANISRRTAP